MIWPLALAAAEAEHHRQLHAQHQQEAHQLYTRLSGCLWIIITRYDISPGGVVGNMLASHVVNPGSIPGRGDT